MDRAHKLCESVLLLHLQLHQLKHCQLIDAASAARSNDVNAIRQHLATYLPPEAVFNGTPVLPLSDAEMKADGSVHLEWDSLCTTRLLINIEQRPMFDAEPDT